MAKTTVTGIDRDSLSVSLVHEEDGKFYSERRQNLDEIVKGVEAFRETDNPKAEMRPIGVMDQATLDEALRDGWFHDPKRIRAWLNKNPHMRIYGGTL